MTPDIFGEVDFKFSIMPGALLVVEYVFIYVLFENWCFNLSNQIKSSCILAGFFIIQLTPSKELIN